MNKYAIMKRFEDTSIGCVREREKKRIYRAIHIVHIDRQELQNEREREREGRMREPCHGMKNQCLLFVL